LHAPHTESVQKYSGRYSYQTWKTEKAVQNKTTKYDTKTNKLDYEDENETSLIESKHQQFDDPSCWNPGEKESSM
jgi:hypothetical protein